MEWLRRIWRTWRRINPPLTIWEEIEMSRIINRPSPLEEHFLRRRTGLSQLEGNMPAKYLIATYGEMEKGRAGEEVMRSLGAVYVGRGRASRLKLLVVDLPERGFLPLAVPSMLGSSGGLAGDGLEASLWEVTETAMTRLDAYCGTGSGSARSTMVRNSQLFTVIERDPDERVTLTYEYRIGGEMSAYVYQLGELLQGYLMWTNVTRMIVESGSWPKFLDWMNRAAAASDTVVVVADSAMGKQGFTAAEERKAEEAMTDSVLLRDRESGPSATMGAATEISF